MTAWQDDWVEVRDRLWHPADPSYASISVTVGVGRAGTHVSLFGYASRRETRGWPLLQLWRPHGNDARAQRAIEDALAYVARHPELLWDNAPRR